MILLTLGALLIAVGVWLISFPDLVKSLEQYDHAQWETLGSPPAYAFSKTTGVFSWVLAQGYESSNSEQVAALGAEAYKKACLAKWLLQTGVLLLVVGFVLSLFGY